ncbi:MAG: hypothetical protein MUE46_17765 [Xanthomonadales bacterium]|nr:hypothetical protein [Xanthomonadales bacterium]
MERRLIAAGLGVLVIGAPAQSHALEVEEPIQNSMTGVGIDLTALVGSEDLVDTRVILESKANVLDSSGCINQNVDTSGIVDWYAEPVLAAHAPFASGESMGINMAHAGTTIAALSQSRVAIFELNEQNLPEFKAFTATNPPSFFRQVAVSPDGAEIAISDVNGTIEFYRRSPTSGWGSTPAQVLNSDGTDLTGRSLTYSSDGAALYVEIQGTSLSVKSFQRNTAGDWEAANVSFPAIPTKTLNRSLAWTADRLLVSGDLTVNAYRRTPNGFELSQSLTFIAAPPEQLNVSPSGFSVRIFPFIQFYSSIQGSLFFPTFTQTDLVDVASTTAGFAGLTRALPGICPRVRFINQSNVSLGSYSVPNSINTSARSLVSGHWGLMLSKISQNGTGELYVVAQKRIFGGSLQGGFE